MDPSQLIFFFLIIIPSAIIHEYAHAWTADQLGDPTARNAGRLTLNPKAHIDFFGTFLLPVILLLVSGGNFIFAYAKPVPFNPFNLKNQKRDIGLVAAAGPVSNLLLAFIFAMLIRFLPLNDFSFILSIIVYANILLAVFNLVPIPPLDGSKILFSLLPDNEISIQIRAFLERYGYILLLFFIFFLFRLISPIIYFIYNLFIGS